MEFGDIITLICACVIAIGVIMYIIMDGFDIGIGILFPFFAKESQRTTMMNSIAPFWDGNETWLVLGGGGLFATFPKAYASALTALYIPIVLFITGLICRGVSFEFRFKSQNKTPWDVTFIFGSTLMAFCQGIVLGSIVQGIKVVDGYYAGGTFDWLTPFTITTGIAVVVGYALLGATWLIIKTEGELQSIARQISYPLLTLVVFFMGVVSIWTPIISEEIFHRWFSLPNLIYLSPIPLLTLYVVCRAYKALACKYEYQPFIFSICLFILSYLGLAVSSWPYIIPRSLTIWEASAATSSQIFILVGVAILLPLILFYTYSTYRVFKGKVTEKGYY